MQTVTCAAAQEAAHAWADDARLSAKTTMPWGAEYAGATLVDPFGSEIDLTSGTSDWDRFIAFTGRDPNGSSPRRAT